MRYPEQRKCLVNDLQMNKTRRSIFKPTVMHCLDVNHSREIKHKKSTPHTFSLKKKPSWQYPSFQSKTGASDTSTVYATTAVRNPTRALRIQPCVPSKNALIRPRMSVLLRRALTRYASAILSCTQSVDVNWSYHTRSSGYSESLDSRMPSLKA